jgi:XTP/dITP diphosphohydrolase
MPDGYQQTFAEMSAEAKNQISHRKQALEKLLPYLAFLA